MKFPYLKGSFKSGSRTQRQRSMQSFHTSKEVLNPGHAAIVLSALISFHTSKEVLNLSLQISGICARSGFHTSKEVLNPVSRLPDDPRVPSFHTSKEVLNHYYGKRFSDYSLQFPYLKGSFKSLKPLSLNKAPM